MRSPLGSSSFGAEMSTPGIGPAMVALSGFGLFDVSQAAKASTSGTTHTNPWDLFMFNPAAVRRKTFRAGAFRVSAETAPTGRTLSVAAGLGTWPRGGFREAGSMVGKHQRHVKQVRFARSFKL